MPLHATWTYPTLQCSGYVRRACEAGLERPLPEWGDELLQKLFAEKTGGAADRPDWAYVHEQLERKDVTLLLLWEQYKAAHPEGYQYSWFCKGLSPVEAQAECGRRLTQCRWTPQNGGNTRSTI